MDKSSDKVGCAIGATGLAIMVLSVIGLMVLAGIELWKSLQLFSE